MVAIIGLVPFAVSMSFESEVAAADRTTIVEDPDRRGYDRPRDIPPDRPIGSRVFTILIAAIAGVGLVALIVALKRDASEALRRASDAPLRLNPQATPARIRLVPRDVLAWANPTTAEDAAEALRGLGFRDAGAFEVEGVEGFRLCGFVRPRDAIRALVQELPETGVNAEVVVRYVDGGMLTITNVSRRVELSRPPGFNVVHLPTEDAAGLVRHMVAEFSGRPVLPIDPEGFAAEFEEVWAAWRDWFNLRGGLDEQELRALAASRGETQDDRTIAANREEQESFALAGLYESVAYRYLTEADLTASQRYRLRSRLVVIHDRLPIEAIAGSFGLSLDDADRRIEKAARTGMHDDQVDGFYPTPLAEWPPRRAFAALNETLPSRRRFRKLAEIDAPIASDVYRPPGI
jgi:hypothetical protein